MNPRIQLKAYPVYSSLPTFGDLGLGAIARLATIDNTPIGASVPAAAAFTNMKQSITITARPPSLGNQGDPVHFFDGDNSKSLHTQYYGVSDGASYVLGRPSTGYTYTPEAQPNNLVINFSSGWNQLVGNQGGRTGFNPNDTRVFHNGQGDVSAYFAAMHVGSTKVGATHFLANPAAQIVGGIIVPDAGGISSYLQGYEIHLADNSGGAGVQCAAIGGTFDLNRSVATITLGEVWLGHRVQSTGTAAADAAYTLAGHWKNGFDASPATIDGGAAVVLARNQRVYYDAVAGVDMTTGIQWYGQNLGGVYSGFDGTSFYFRVNGSATQLQVTATGATVAGQLTVTANAALSGQITMPTLATLTSLANDAAAATAGIPVGGLYHNAGAVRVRLT